MKKIASGAIKVSVGTIISRLLGYARDMLVARYFGAGIFADAFYAAYRIPNLFRRLLGEGSVSAAVIPVLSETKVRDGDDAAGELISASLTFLILVLSAITIAGIVWSREIVSVIAYGFSDEPDKLSLTISLTRLMFPFMFFVSLAAFVGGALNTYGIFFVPSVAPGALSVSEISFMLAVAPLLSVGNSQVNGLAVSVIIGGALQVVAQLPHLARLPLRIKPNFNFALPGIKKIGSLMLPTTVGISVDQINAFVDTACASFLPLGSITALYYSNRLMQLPLAIFGISLATVSLPAMSYEASRGDIRALKETLNYSIRLMLFAVIPSAAGLVVFGRPIIKLLFEHGRFDAYASSLTYSALAFYALGLPAYSAVKIFASAFYSFKETAYPVKVAVISMLLNASLNIILMERFAVGGLALATAISSAFNGFWLFVALRRKIGLIGGRRIAVSFLKISIASAGMCFLTHYIFFVLLKPSDGAIATKIITLGAIVAAVLFYILLSRILLIEELSGVKEIFSEKLRRYIVK